MTIRPTIMEIDLNALNHNINEIKKFIGTKEIMPIIKANAYGTYINKNLSVIKDFKIVGVATVSEGKELREVGFQHEIFILNQPSIEELETILNYNLTIGISSLEFIEEVISRKEKIKIHLEIETGMSRTGIVLEDIPHFLDLVITNNIEVEGIYTHLSSADTDEDYTTVQLATFNQAVSMIKSKIPSLKYIHSLASNGIIHYLSNDTNLVRPGIILYGYPSSEESTNKINLKPISKLKTKVTFLKTVPKNTAISYSKTYITDKETKIATIPIGYADGLRRCLSNKGEVIINNKKCKIIGNICMDSCMVDVTDIKDLKVGDEVYIWDNKNITVEEIAKKCNTINYEILSTISNRVPRVFIK